MLSMLLDEMSNSLSEALDSGIYPDGIYSPEVMKEIRDIIDRLDSLSMKIVSSGLEKDMVDEWPSEHPDLNDPWLEEGPDDIDMDDEDLGSIDDEMHFA